MFVQTASVGLQSHESVNFCCEHKSVPNFVAELLDEVRQAEHADVAVDADHGLRNYVKKWPFIKSDFFWSEKIDF